MSDAIRFIRFRDEFIVLLLHLFMIYRDTIRNEKTLKLNSKAVASELHPKMLH